MAGFGDLSSLRGDVSPLTALAVKIANDESNYYVEKALPYALTASRAGTFNKYTAASFLGDAKEIALRASGAAARRIDMRVTAGTFSGDDYALELPIADPERGEAAVAGLDIQADGMQALMHRLMIQKERLAHTLFTTDANWTGNTTLSTPWDNSSSTMLADMLAAVRAFKLQSGRYPDAAIFSGKDWNSVLKHPDIVAKVVANGATMATVTYAQAKRILAEQFGFKEVFIAGAVANSANPGLAASNAEIWSSEEVFLGYFGIGEESTKDSLSCAKCLGPKPWTAKIYRDETVDSDVLQVSSTFDLAVMSPDLGYLVKNTQT